MCGGLEDTGVLSPSQTSKNQRKTQDHQNTATHSANLYVRWEVTFTLTTKDKGVFVLKTRQ